RLERNAILSPSGNQFGTVSVAGSVVSCTGFLPSASATQISALVPSRHLSKATLFPSGEKRGRLFRRLASLVNGTGGALASLETGDMGTDQRLLEVATKP